MSEFGDLASSSLAKPPEGVICISTLAEAKSQASEAELHRVDGVAKLWKLEKAAKILDMPLSTAYEHVRTGLFESFVVKIGRQVRVHPDRFQRWLDAGGEALPGGWRQEPEGTQ